MLYAPSSKRSQSDIRNAPLRPRPSLSARDDPADLFLRAERRPDGVRTFRLTPGQPEPTSYGEDSFRRVFGIALHAHVGRQRVQSG
jgi:hypothetical protein